MINRTDTNAHDLSFFSLNGWDTIAQGVAAIALGYPV
jgi:hypothetical protein